jgi:dihydrofolate reductase
MPELLIDFITSLDGYAAADGWPGWWGLEGPEYLAWLGEQPEADYTVLMGATTYRLMSGFAAEGEPGTDALAAMSKVVFSTTLSEPLSWANTQVVTQDPVEAVREMKEKASKSMRSIGSLTLCRSLLKAGLVDRFRVVVFPVITGSSGRERIYDGYPDVALDMISSRTFDGRIQLLEYVPKIPAGPPGTNDTALPSGNHLDSVGFEHAFRLAGGLGLGLCHASGQGGQDGRDEDAGDAEGQLISRHVPAQRRRQPEIAAIRAGVDTVTRTALSVTRRSRIGAPGPSTIIQCAMTDRRSRGYDWDAPSGHTSSTQSTRSTRPALLVRARI